MLDFGKRILMVGYGSVAQCTLPVLFKHLNVPPKNITVIDFEDRGRQLQSWLDQGVKFQRERLAPENLGAILGRYLSAGDVLIDLAWNIDCCDIVRWCHDHGVLYVNTSVEVWDPYDLNLYAHPTRRTLYARHMDVHAMTAKWKDKGPTAVLEHGANPGLISHFVKHALLEIGHRALADRKYRGANAEELKQFIADRAFNRLAQKLNVKVIHCSERDTQITHRPKEVDEFVNTWSVEGFREEGTTTAELGWGTHEKELPPRAYLHEEGPKNQICLAQMGMNTWVRSWVPHDTVRGMVIRHGEAYTISERLTVWDGEQAVYRPTVHYAYCPCDAAIASLQELRGNDYELQRKVRIMGDEIVTGSDTLGALLMGHAYNSWWTGSSLSIEESRRLIPNQNATTMQVAISVVAAVMWMIEHPNEGVVVPDDLPHDQILETCKPYLGKFITTSSDWTPLKYYANAFEGYAEANIDPTDPWQFKNFLVGDRN
ncbi:MAG: homospermidine synthase [Planctomycetes bacterium]|nr:homospermidine synthase [Planctomycetota bacterium]